jgi:hypothetical protein
VLSCLLTRDKSLQARAPRAKETPPSKLVLRKQRNEVPNHSRVARNETHPPVGRNVGNPYDRQNNLRFGTERFKKVGHSHDAVIRVYDEVN